MSRALLIVVALMSIPAGAVPSAVEDRAVARVMAVGGQLAPHGKRVGELHHRAKGKGSKIEQTFALEQGVCYTIVAAGGDGVIGVSLKLWDPVPQLASATAGKEV